MRIRTTVWAASLLGTLGLAAPGCSDDQGVSESGGVGGDGGQGDGIAGAREASSGAGAGGAGGNGDLAGPSRECLAPEVDQGSGTVRCKTTNGGVYTHRNAVGSGCHYIAPEVSEGGTGGVSAGGADGAGGAEPIDCDAAACPGVYPYCEWGLTILGGRCAEGCLTDSDCPTGRICSCSLPSGLGQCAQAACAIDDDCGDGLRCVARYNDCTEWPSNALSFSCEVSQDECQVTQDCPGQGMACEPSSDGGYQVCVEAAICGRPFLVDGQARASDLAPRSDWRDLDRAPELIGLTRQERDVLARHYARMGQMEHASIAAFARFSLQLLSISAPPDLVDACTRAIADETRHARICFTLASHYAGDDLGPGPLAIEGCLGASTIEEILELVITEGCVGETVAALQLAEAAEHAIDPVVQHALLQMSDDERRHAELGFRFVAWVLNERPDLVEHVERIFCDHLRDDRTRAADETSSSRLSAHGLLSESELAAVRFSALQDAIRPCAAALLTSARRWSRSVRDLSPVELVTPNPSKTEHANT
jgi:hypothetical protein